MDSFLIILSGRIRLDAKSSKKQRSNRKTKEDPDNSCPDPPYYLYKSVTNLLKVFVFHKCVQDFFDHIPFFIRFDRL